MIFKIKQKKSLMRLAPPLSLLAFFCARKIPFVVLQQTVMYTLMVVFLVSFALFLIDRYIGTTISVEADSVVIKNIFGVKKVDFNEICDITIKPYTERFINRGRTTHFEYRMKMTIVVLGRKNIILNDTASEKSGLLGIILFYNVRLRDEDVKLYQAYKAIKNEIDQYDFPEYSTM